MWQHHFISRSADRMSIPKHSMLKDCDSLPRTSSAPCQTSEFRMSVLLAKGENSGSQKDLHNRSPIAKNKSSHPREKSGMRARDTLRLVNEKQSTLLYEVRIIEFWMIRILDYYLGKITYRKHLDLLFGLLFCNSFRLKIKMKIVKPRSCLPFWMLQLVLKL